jgi:hypothetical protein
MIVGYNRERSEQNQLLFVLLEWLVMFTKLHYFFLYLIAEIAIKTATNATPTVAIVRPKATL